MASSIEELGHKNVTQSPVVLHLCAGDTSKIRKLRAQLFTAIYIYIYIYIYMKFILQLLYW